MEIKNLKFSWSKWGRVTTGLEIEGRPKDWHCQVCGEHQPFGIEAFLFSIADKEFLRICSICQHVRVIRMVSRFHRLKRLRIVHGLM